MDALRLILIIVGVLILAGIYLYSTRKRGAHEDNINDVRIMSRPDYSQAHLPSPDAESLINPDSNNLSEQLAQLGGMVSQYKAKPAPASSDESGNERLPEALQYPQQEAVRVVSGLPELIVLNIMVRPGGVFPSDSLNLTARPIPRHACLPKGHGGCGSNIASRDTGRTLAE